MVFDRALERLAFLLPISGFSAGSRAGPGRDRGEDHRGPGGLYYIADLAGIEALGALCGARLTADGLAQAEAHMRDEASGPRGSLIPVADNLQAVGEGEEDPIATLSAIIAGLKGNATLVETQAAGGGVGPSGAPQKEWANLPGSLHQRHSKQLHQGGENPDGDNQHSTQADGEALFQFLEIALGRKVVLNQVGLLVGQHFGLRFRHSGGGQAFDEAVGVECDGAHGANVDGKSRGVNHQMPNGGLAS